MPPGQLKTLGWKRLTADFPDHTISSVIIGICQYGARIGYEGPRETTTIYPNLSSALSDESQVTSDIENELSKHRLQVLPNVASLPKYYIASPLGLTDKADGSKRRIHHLSHPATSSLSINSQIPERYGSITYSSINDAVNAVQRWGRDCILVKRDFESTFHHIRISPLDSPLLGFHWKGKFYSECFLPFGLRTAPYLINIFVEVFHWCLEAEFRKQNLAASVIHYLDDFFLVLPPTAMSKTYTRTFANLCSEAGLSIKDSKSEERVRASFTGIELDTRSMTIRLPTNKLRKAQTIVQTPLQGDSLTLLDFQRITGYLNFVCTVVPLGRTILRRLYNMELHFPPGNRHQRRRISTEARKDLV